MAWAKLAFYNGLPGLVSLILFIVTDRFVDFYPLKQFAPVIHGKPPPQGRIAMGRPPHRNTLVIKPLKFR